MIFWETSALNLAERNATFEYLLFYEHSHEYTFLNQKTYKEYKNSKK